MRLLLLIQKLLLTILTTLIFISCNKTPALWPLHDLRIESVSFQLNVADSANILQKEGEFYILHKIHDSLVTNRDTIEYSTILYKDDETFFGRKIKTIKKYYSSPKVNEFYVFDKGAVKLAGYSTGDSLNPYTIFNNPLVILPAPGILTDSSFAQKQKWNNAENRFVNDGEIKTSIKAVKTGVLLINGKRENFIIYQLRLTTDIKVGYGKQELVIPNAIILESKLLYGKTKGLMYEWAIKTEGVTTNSQSKEKDLTKNYLELIQYNLI